MKIKKIIIIFLFALIVQLIVSCCGGCGEPLELHYTNKEIIISSLDNRGEVPLVSSSTTFIKTAYGIRINFTRENIACIKKTNTFFIQSANALSCKCPPDHYLPRDSITSLKIFTLNDFDSNHSANSDISDYFKVFKKNTFTPISSYLKNSDSSLYYNQGYNQDTDILLMSPPTINNKHKFKVQIILSDGRVLEQETLLIELI